MRLSKSIDTYIALVKKAWGSTWKHKEWWLVAAIAGLGNTGAVFNSVFNTFWRLHPADRISVETIEEILPPTTWLLANVRNFLALETVGRIAYVLGALLLLVLLIAVVTAAQHMLLVAVKNASGRSKLTWARVKKELQHLHLWRLFSVNALVRLALVILVMGAAIPLSLLLTNEPALNLFAYAGTYAVILPIAFCANIIGMFMMVVLVQDDMSIGKAFRESLHLLRHHWLIALEVSLILFIINFFGSSLLVFALLILAFITSFLFQAAVAIGSYLLMALISFIALLTAGAFAVIYGGAITMFNYTVWSLLKAQLKKHVHLPTAEHVARMILRPFKR